MSATTPEPIDEPSDAGAAPPLTATGISCVRGDRALFSDLELRVGSGEVLQVEGANGSGKTTLLRAICGLVPVDTGEITWEGLAIADADSSFHAELNYVGHSPAVKLDLTPLENLRISVALHGGAARMDPMAALERIGLGGLEDTVLRRLSAGQCRRVALAQLLVVPGRLWVLDEPFTALDATGKHLVERLIGEHCAHGGLVLVSTHQPLDLGTVPVQHLRMGD